MSRIGKLPIVLPAKVEFIMDGAHITVKGPKGELHYTVPAGVQVEKTESDIVVSIEKPEFANLWGLVRTLVDNMVVGVSKGYEKKLHVIGVGYNAKAQGQKLILSLGYSHPVEHTLPTGITATAEKDPKGNDIVTIIGIDKQLVGEQAAKIRGYRLPEPYKGKGVRYFGEHIKLKAGKTAGK